MSKEFTYALSQIVDVEMFIQTKKSGVLTKSDPLKLDPCTTLDLQAFYEAMPNSAEQMSYLTEFKPMQCLNEKANVQVLPIR